MKSFARLSVLALAAVAVPSFAQNFTLTDGGTTAVINPGNGTGLDGLQTWFIGNGPDQVFQQTYYLQIGTGAVGLLSGIGSIASSQPTSALAQVSYVNAPNSLEADIRYLLTGSAPSSSDIAEIVTFFNRGNGPLTLRLFEYDDFDLNGSAGGDTAVLQNTSTIFQSEDGTSVTVGDVPVPTAWQIGSPSTIGSAVLSGSLSSSGSPFGPGDAAFAFEWDVTIGAGQSWQMSKDKRLNIVPEPCSMLALGGLSALVALRRRKKA